MPPRITKDAIDKYKESFKLFDKDMNGEIDTKELMLLMQAIGQNPSKAEVEDMIHEVDEDGTGTISFDEFIWLMERHAKTPFETEQQLRAAFRVFDKDKNGFISSEELRDVMMSLGEKMSEDEIQDMLAEADIDGDGQIDYEEFVIMMTK